MSVFLPGQTEGSCGIVLLLQLPLLQHSGLDTKNQRVQNAVVGQASILQYNHPRPRNHQAYHDCLVLPEQILQDIPAG